MFEVYQGDDDILIQRFVDENGAALDIENIVIAMTIRDPKTKKVLITKTSATVTEIEKKVPYTDGIAWIYLSRTDTEVLKGGYDYDFQLTFPNGTVATFARDFILVKEDVTP